MKQAFIFLAIITLVSLNTFAQNEDDPLIGVWSTNMCGKPIVLSIAANDEEAKSKFAEYKLKATLINGREVGYGFKNGDAWSYLSPMAAPGVYEGKTLYRNLLFKKWVPTRIRMADVNGFTAYDDPTVESCGGAMHIYERKEPRVEAKTPPTTQAINRRDGNWWRGLESMWKTVYVTGFFDGIQMGNRFSYWGFVDDEKSSACLSKVDASAAEYSKKYLSNITVGQVGDGLNEFYEDYRNRSLLVVDATWLVLNEISGKPRAEMDAMIEYYRKNAKP
jgi:hypothetical protein